MMINNQSTTSDLYKFYAHCNLGMHIKYYNEHKRLVHNEIVWINQKLQDSTLNQKDRVELEIKKQTYQSSYHDYMIINCYLMMYAHFEECLAVTFRLFPKGEYATKGTGLDRFKEAFLSKYSVRITEAPRWSFLHDCSQLRDVLLHAAGNITLVRDKKKIDPVISRNSDLVRFSSSRIFLKEQILNEFSKALSVFVEWLSAKIEKQHNKSLKEDAAKGRGAP